MQDDLLQICTESIDIGGVYGALSDSACGAELIFLGVVRSENDGRIVSAVTYEAFEPLALTVFRELAEEVRERICSTLRVVILHRVGTLKVGEVSTVIGVATPHRSESYEASRYLIEQLKNRVPIWKKEHYIDGEKSWLDGAEIASAYSGGDLSGRKVLSNGAE